MEAQAKPYIYLSGLVAHARLQKGFSTLKEFYRERKPLIDYQTWLHIESGRRIPSPSTLVLIGDMLNIDRESLIIAYCKDKFGDDLTHQVLDSFQYRKFFNIDTLIQAKDYDRSEDYVFTTEQLKAMQQDPRLRLYLMYTYDRESMTSFSRLASFFAVAVDEARSVIEHLRTLGLVEINGEIVKKIYPHTTVPITADISDLRKKLLLKSLDLNIRSDSYISNYHINITEKSYKKLLGLFDFVEANLIKMEKEDHDDLSSFRVQIAIAGNKLNERGPNDKEE